MQNTKLFVGIHIDTDGREMISLELSKDTQGFGITTYLVKEETERLILALQKALYKGETE